MFTTLSNIPIHKDAGSKYSKTQLRTSDHWKVHFKSFPTVYDTSILSNIGVSYTVGKPLTSKFQPKCVPLVYFLPACLHTSLIPRTASKLLWKFTVWKFFQIDLEVTLEVFLDLWWMTKKLPQWLLNQSGRTSELILKLFMGLVV